MFFDSLALFWVLVATHTTVSNPLPVKTRLCVETRGDFHSLFLHVSQMTAPSQCHLSVQYIEFIFSAVPLEQVPLSNLILASFYSLSKTFCGHFYWPLTLAWFDFWKGSYLYVLIICGKMRDNLLHNYNKKL